MSEIAFVDAPGGFSFPATPLFKPRSQVGFCCVLTASRIRGLHTHWNGARDIPHTKGECHGCEKGMPVRWSGYASACLLDEGQKSKTHGDHGFLEITERAYEQIAEILAIRRALRGLALFVRRSNARPNSKVLCKQIAWTTEGDLPAELDARAFIERLYCIRPVRLNGTEQHPENEP